jgi:hypothetical protein
MMYSFKSKDVEASVVLAMAEDRSANLGATKASAPVRRAEAKKMEVENLMVNGFLDLSKVIDHFYCILL